MEIGAFEIIGGIFLFFAIILSRSAELLGAELVLPIAKIAFDLEHKESVEVAAPAIWIAVLIKFIAALWKKDEEYEHRRVIDFKFATVITPLVLIGAFWGEVIHETLAPVLETFLFWVIVAYLLFKTYIELIKEYREYKKSLLTVAPITKSQLGAEGSTSGLTAIGDNGLGETTNTEIGKETSVSLIDRKSHLGLGENAERSNYLINLEQESSLHSAEEKDKKIQNRISQYADDPRYDKVYKPRHLKRLIPLIIMIVMLG